MEVEDLDGPLVLLAFEEGVQKSQEDCGSPPQLAPQLRRSSSGEVEADSPGQEARRSDPSSHSSPSSARSFATTHT